MGTGWNLWMLSASWCALLLHHCIALPWIKFQFASQILPSTLGWSLLSFNMIAIAICYVTIVWWILVSGPWLLSAMHCCWRQTKTQYHSWRHFSITHKQALCLLCYGSWWALHTFVRHLRMCLTMQLQGMSDRLPARKAEMLLLPYGCI